MSGLAFKSQAPLNIVLQRSQHIREVKCLNVGGCWQRLTTLFEADGDTNDIGPMQLLMRKIDVTRNLNVIAA